MSYRFGMILFAWLILKGIPPQWGYLISISSVRINNQQILYLSKKKKEKKKKDLKLFKTWIQIFVSPNFINQSKNNIFIPFSKYLNKLK